jgi:hypothetical protein
MTSLSQTLAPLTDYLHLLYKLHKCALHAYTHYTVLYYTHIKQSLPQQWHSSRTLASYSLHPSSDADFLRSSSASAGVTSHDTSADTLAAASEYEDSSSSSSSSSNSSRGRAELASVQHCIALRALLLNSTSSTNSSSNSDGYRNGSYTSGDSPESDTPPAAAVAIPASALLQLVSVVQEGRFLHGPVVGARTVPGPFPVAGGENRQLQCEAVALLQAMLQPGGAVQQLCCVPGSSGKHYYLVLDNVLHSQCCQCTA